MTHLSRADLDQRIRKITGQPAVNFQEIQRGYTPAKRLVVSLADGSSVFIKVATTELTAGWLRNEQRIYQALSGPFMPAYIGWDDHPAFPLLMLEDLSAAFWPPPWSEERIAQVVEMLNAVANTPVPVPLASSGVFEALIQGWANVAQEPESFLSLGLVSDSWLQQALPILLNQPYEEAVAGDALLHLDVRSDNICFKADQAILIDWNNACLGNPKLDFGGWLPSLAAEGGPRPETILPDGQVIAALVCGYFASRAGRPKIPDAPHVRDIQRVQLKTALPWTIRALDLPPADGASAGINL